jgi:hypothetical protein
LLKKGDGKFSSKDPGLLEKGIPSEFSEAGNLNLYTAKDDVCGFVLYMGSYLNARSVNLGVSSGAGRVRATKNFFSRNLEQLVK